MRQIITTYLIVLLLLSIGFFGLGALASAQELRDPMRPPPLALQKFRQAKQGEGTSAVKAAPDKPQPRALQLTSILISADRRIAIIDDKALSVGDRIRGAKLVKVTRTSARLVRKGKVINLNLGKAVAGIEKRADESDQ